PIEVRLDVLGDAPALGEREHAALARGRLDAEPVAREQMDGEREAERLGIQHASRRALAALGAERPGDVLEARVAEHAAAVEAVVAATGLGARAANQRARQADDERIARLFVAPLVGRARGHEIERAARVEEAVAGAHAARGGARVDAQAGPGG